MTEVKALVIRAAGINCDCETVNALKEAGADAKAIHINALIQNPAIFEEFHIAVVPGGFSYGDDVAAGKILANQVIHHLADAMQKFIADGKLILGICNGFQVLVKAGLLPAFTDDDSKNNVTITHNDNGKFEDRWVHLKPASDNCVFLDPNKTIYLPIAHGEGKVVPKDEQTLTRLQNDNHIALRYVDQNDNTGPFPINPNGSTDDIAALTDSTGRILGLMPHPERFTRPTQHPRWTRQKQTKTADGITIFTNAVNYVKNNL
jgi:phosphoribosylformylglycinamidine synthase